MAVQADDFSLRRSGMFIAEDSPTSSAAAVGAENSLDGRPINITLLRSEKLVPLTWRL